MTVEERVERLERQNRRMKVGVWALMALLFVLLFAIGWPAVQVFTKQAVTAWTPTLDTVKAETFLLRDDTGRTRGGLYQSEDGVVLGLFDENGKGRVGLGMHKDGPSLFLADENGNLRAALGTTSTTQPDGKIIIYPESSLILFSAEGTVEWSAP